MSPRKKRNLRKEWSSFREAIGVGLIGVSILLFISLASFDSSDPSFIWQNASPPNDTPKNLAGRVGAHLANPLILLFGWGAFLLPVFFTFLGLRKITGRKDPIPYRLLGMSILLISSSTLLSLLSLKMPVDSSLLELFKIGSAGIDPGGEIVGRHFAMWLFSGFNWVSYLIVITSLSLGLTLSFDLSPGLILRSVKRLGAEVVGRLKIVLSRVRAASSAVRKKKAVTKRGVPVATPSESFQRPDTGEPAELKEEKVVPGGEIKRGQVEEVLGSEYILPSPSLLDPPDEVSNDKIKEDLFERSQLLKNTLRGFGIETEVLQVLRGPAVTKFELGLSPGVKVSSITSLTNDIALALATPNVRIEAPIPGKQAIGIEIPNRVQEKVRLREVIESEEFQRHSSKLSVCLGKDITGNPVVFDLRDMPHLLVAGATGTGKSICINSLIISVLYKSFPDEVKFLLIDPKRVELSAFRKIPHLLYGIVSSPKNATIAVKKLVVEMERRYELFASLGVRDIDGYNNSTIEAEEGIPQKLPYIVMIVDELADLMVATKRDFEEVIQRLAQMSRAVGIHLVLATQRPSVDVITGIIKANFPSRIAFQVASRADSRTILDANGAEKLLGKGDMLFSPANLSTPIRVQGSFISRAELERVIRYIESQKVKETETEYEGVGKGVEQKSLREDEPEDELFQDALQAILETGKASASFLQRRFRIGYNRAARLIDEMESRGIIGPQNSQKPREILINRGSLKK